MTDIVTAEDAIDRHLILMDSVVVRYLKGDNVHEIAKALKISPSRAGTLLREWREMAQQNEAIKSRAVLALHGMDKHYNTLIRKTYGVLDDVEVDGTANQRLSAIKLIADLEAKRIELLQKAGALEDSDTARQIVETERKQKILMDILKEVVGPCDHCRPRVQERLSQITQNEVVVIKADE